MNAAAEAMVRVGDNPPEKMATLSLVLSAAGIDHLVDHQSGSVLVATGDAARAMAEWTTYEEENHGWPSPPPPRPAMQPGTPPTLGLMSLLALFFAHTGSWQAHSLWFARGAVDSEAVLVQGQWWRLFTGMTLHADLAHLAGNGLIGGLVIHLLSKTLGYGTAWLLLLLAGAAGNLLNLVLRESAHLSVGLSTAVFAAVGLLTGRQLVHRRTRSLRTLLLPLGAGAGLLVLLGSGDARTDVGAHFFGFVAGVCGGLLTGLVLPVNPPHRPRLQAALFTLATTLLIACWWLALR
ncbi:MAG: rhomboid family intramembrane serine protease [Desulfobulbus sp.]|jgi:membrane associated rhomboid family serine protease|nr:rhomboid family intramembrane serine protease [Desulfobulbus sp.]